MTQIHSNSKNIPELSRQGDILVVAVGQPQVVQADWVKNGACVIDVGINRYRQTTLTGDVDFEAVSAVAGALSPVPGGVGPLTIMFLMHNLIKATELALNV